MTEWLTSNVVPLAPILAVVIGPSVALFIFFLGRSAYYCQKEFELVRDRYLNEGLDQLVTRADYALQVFNHNWAHSLNIIKTVRGLKRDANIDVFLQDLVPPDAAMLELSVNRKVRELLQSEVTYDVHQLLASFVHNSFLKMRDDLGNAIRLYIEDSPEFQGKLSPKAIEDQYLPVLFKLSAESNKYYFFVKQIQELANLLQKKKFGFKAVSEFGQKAEVKNIINNLETYYAEQIGDAKSSNNAFNPDAGKAGAGKCKR